MDVVTEAIASFLTENDNDNEGINNNGKGNTSISYMTNIEFCK